MKRLRSSLGKRDGGATGVPPLQPAAGNFRQGAIRVLAHKLLRGDTRRSTHLLKAALVACLLLVAGCGESEGVAENAIVSVYVSAPLCAEAKRELARDGGKAGDVRVRVICLSSAEGRGKLDLATIGANARRATEDAAAVGYIGEPTRAASRFSEPILEEAGVAQLSQISGTAAMKKLLQAIDEAGDSGSLRHSVNDALQ
jgi:hypothetical protein